MTMDKFKNMFSINTIRRLSSNLKSINKTPPYQELAQRVSDLEGEVSKYKTQKPTYDELAQRVSDLEGEITKHEAQQIEAKTQKMEAISTLAGGIAHDLNNILSGIVSYPELLLMDLPEDSSLRPAISTIQESGQRAADMVKDMLTFSRRENILTQLTNLNEIISSYLNTQEKQKFKSDYPLINIETNLETGLLNISASPTHLNITINNLLYNAAQAMPNGGVVNISTQNQYVDTPIRGYEEIKEGDYVTLKFSDTGIISSEDIQRIFEPFYTKKVLKRNNGLEMAVVHGIVKNHNGYIDVQSVEGEGTSFTFYFPATRETISEDEAPVSIDDYTGKGESILVVDDVPEQREIASSILTRLGYDVNAVPSGEEAVNYIKTNPVDLLVLDMIMDPGISGPETYKKILEIHPRQKAIIASGFSETEDIDGAIKLGVGAYIKKPYTLEKIGTAVRKELNKLRS